MSFASTNPTTGVVERRFESMSSAALENALAHAAAAYALFRNTSFKERSRLMVAAAELFEGEVPDIARVLTTEMGKPFAQAKGEVAKCASALRWFAEHAEALLADDIVESSHGRRIVRHEPIGPVLAIMPWNFPLWQVIRFAGPALMLGNVALVKHAPNVPETSSLLENLFTRAGYPDWVFTNLMIEVDEIAHVISDDRVAAVTLTGSEQAGRSVAEVAGRALKKCVLELGGSDPFVVMSSADVPAAVSIGIRSRCQNNGQSCIAAKRFIVAASVFDEFVDRFTEGMASLVVGDPLDQEVDVGPLVSEAQRSAVMSQVDDARSRGAEVRCGGLVPKGPGWFFPPTVLVSVTPDMRVCTEEVFAPVATIEPAADLTEAIAIANRTRFGLGASVWTADPEEQQRAVDEMEAGQVFVNSMVASTPELPFGGRKGSGFGRELGAPGLIEFSNMKTVSIT